MLFKALHFESLILTTASKFRLPFRDKIVNLYPCFHLLTSHWLGDILQCRFYPRHPVRAMFSDVSCSPASGPVLTHLPGHCSLALSALDTWQPWLCPTGPSHLPPQRASLLPWPSLSPHPHSCPSLGLPEAQVGGPRPSSLHTLYLEVQCLLYLKLQPYLPSLAPVEHLQLPSGHLYLYTSLSLSIQSVWTLWVLLLYDKSCKYLEKL